MVLTLIEKEHLIDNIWAFRFRPSGPFMWTPGQYMRVELPHDNPDAEGTKRWFTISSAPYDGIAQITTRVTESTFKQALSKLAEGGELQLLEEPEGDFVWQDSELPIIFVAGGIGVTPFRSILRQRLHDNLPLNVTLIWGSRTPDLPFKDEVEQWQAANSGFKVHYATGNPLTAEKIAELEPDINTSLVYVSGPEPMVQALSKDLIAHGLPETQVKQDEFPNYTEKNY